MAYPPALPAGGFDNDSPAHDAHPGSHNDIAAAIASIVAELGADPKAAFADLTERLESIDTAIAALPPSAVPTSRAIGGLTGSGLLGGGTLAADRALVVDWGTGANQVRRGNDGAYTDPRTPTSHASTHASAGGDPIAPSDIGAVPTGRTVTAGTGLTGGGALSANITVALAAIAASAFLANNTGGSAAPTGITPAQATALLAAMVGDSGAGGTKGLVPAPASGDAAAGKYLSAGGSFSVPGIASFARHIADPNINGLAAWSMDPANAQNNTPLVLGTLYIQPVILEKDLTSALRTVGSWQATAGTSTTGGWYAVFDAAGAQLGATSASQHTTWNSSSGDRSATTGTFGASKGDQVYLGMLNVGGSLGVAMARMVSSGSNNANGLSGATLRAATAGTGLSAMPSSITPGSLVASNIHFFMSLK